MLVTFTDFGLAGPYWGQVAAVFAAEAPQVPVINLIADAPAYNPFAASYLLAPMVRYFPRGAVFMGVVDPGVGGDRQPLMIEAGNQHFVGPDNGLFEMVMRRALADKSQKPLAAWRIDWRPDEPLSQSFHGRDLFAPVAARLAIGMRVDATPLDLAAIRYPDWPDDLHQIIYVDHYGNAMTGIRAESLAQDQLLNIGGQLIAHATVFSAVPVGEAFWYANSMGMVEIAINRGRADQALGLAVGHEVTVGG
ncbi:MAG: SAM-dependent chlorinase/fluorinase [Pseudomonadota bacterium]